MQNTMVRGGGMGMANQLEWPAGEKKCILEVKGKK